MTAPGARGIVSDRAVIRNPYMSGTLSRRLSLLRCFLLFDRAAGLSSVPTADLLRPTRAEVVKAGRRSVIEAHSHVSRPRLDSLEHGGRLDDHGP